MCPTRLLSTIQPATRLIVVLRHRHHAVPAQYTRVRLSSQLGAYMFRQVTRVTERVRSFSSTNTFVTIISSFGLMLGIILLLTAKFYALFFIWWRLSTINKRLTYLLTYINKVWR